MSKSDLQDYNQILLQTVAVIEDARFQLAKQLNTTVSATYYQIGKLLYSETIEGEYGDAVIKRLSHDLKERYPRMGLSPRQLWNMRKFFQRYKDSDQKLLRSVAVLPWSHNLLLISNELRDEEVQYYVDEDLSKGWNRDLLLNALKLQMHLKAIGHLSENNFEKTLPAVQANYASMVFKSTYNLGFLGITEPLLELELEARLVKSITRFLLELGRGFTFIGNQYTLEYNGKESKVDMLFYHRGLNSLIAIDLKIGAFKPEYAGKMNYYLSLLDRLERKETENKSIGIILCAEKDETEIELALEGIGKPIGVADYQLIVNKDELQEVVNEEIRAYNSEKNFQ